jgi:hypothetical protein
MKPLINFLPAVVLLVACGVGAGPELGDFPALTRQETDPPFTLTAPSSRSPAPFKFASSNAAVATISGAQVTLHGRGDSTITASQDGIGSYGPTSKSTTLTVIAPCAEGQTPVNGACAAVPTCVAPATLVNNQCVTPTLTATSVTNGTLTYQGVSRTDNWANANTYCQDSVAEGASNWRLPTQDELTALYTSGKVAGHNWNLGNTWSSVTGNTVQAASHVAVNLQNGVSADRLDTAVAYVSCVR